MKRGTLILLFWEYVAGLLGQEERCKSHSQSPKSKVRSQKRTMRLSDPENLIAQT